MHPTQTRPAFSPSMASFTEACKIFVTCCEADRHAILLACQSGDKDLLLERLHALKGALLVFGEKETAALCERLEEDLQNNSILFCEAALQHLDTTLRRLIDAYR